MGWSNRRLYFRAQQCMERTSCTTIVKNMGVVREATIVAGAHVAHLFVTNDHNHPWQQDGLKPCRIADVHRCFASIAANFTKSHKT